jgi:hypothetical protein
MLSCLQDMRAELLSGEQEKELAVMVQDLLQLEQVAKDLAVKLGRTPSNLEWMEAADAQSGTEDLQAALTAFQARLHAGRSAKQVCASVRAGCLNQQLVPGRSWAELLALAFDDLADLVFILPGIVVGCANGACCCRLCEFS